MLSTTPRKNCCIIKSGDEFYYRIYYPQCPNYEVNRKKELISEKNAIKRPDCFDMIFKSESVKVCLFLHFIFLFLCLQYDVYYVYEYLNIW